MRFSKYLVTLAIVASMQLSSASTRDTMDLVGGTSYNTELGWFGEAWNDSAQKWCNDTTYKDTSIDTVVKIDTSVTQVLVQKSDTINKGTDSQKVVPKDTLVNDTTVVKDTSYVDSTTWVVCHKITTFTSDTGGLAPGVPYINYKYKIRNYWAQLPMVWANWAGIDASGYNTLLIVFKGLLPVHKINLEFIYAAWGAYKDSIKLNTKVGDGIGVLSASPDSWVTRVITIPDSVEKVGPTGIIFNIVNAPGNTSGTSDIGNIKVARIALLASTPAVNYSASPRGLNERFQFIPATSGKVAITVHSLKGELLYSTSIGVEANKIYSLRQLAKRFNGKGSPQVRLLKVNGAGVDAIQRIW